MMGDVTIRPLDAGDGGIYRAVRLEALARYPEAFGASHAEALAQSEAEFAARLAGAAPGAVFGAFVGGALAGTAGLLVHRSAKSAHKGVLWGMYVDPAQQGRGIGRALVKAVIGLARLHVLVLQTSVVVDNAAALRLYLACGFRSYGIERRALRVDGRFLDEDHLALDLDAPFNVATQHGRPPGDDEDQP